MLTRVAVAAILLSSAALAEPMEPDEARQALAEAAERARGHYAGMSFDEFEQAVPWYPEAGKYVVNGDIPIRNRKLLREFWERNVRNSPASAGGDTPEFTILNIGGLDQFWNRTLRRQLTYCVSTDFGGRYPAVVADMQQAAAAWEAVADLDFVHLAAEDGRCDAANSGTLFDVRPIDAGGEFLALAFFPNEPRDARSVFIDPSSFALDPNGNLTLRGILRHELGHVLGARHEHTRPEAGRCFEDSDWRGVTDYDAFSVMHYPQCNGLGDWSLRLTETDKNGVACIYGAAPGFVIDPAVCTPVAPEAQVVVQRFTGETVDAGQMRDFGAFPVRPLTRFEARLSGSGPEAGDPDLYVKFDGPALILDFDCRPFSVGPDETCSVDVPAGRSVASVMVHGFEASRFDLSVSRVAP